MADSQMLEDHAAKVTKRLLSDCEMPCQMPVGISNKKYAWEYIYILKLMFSLMPTS